ncbi:F420-0--gamma-glutamyl ligase [Steroidobacter denitrificans]|uniref:F420-0--gamma-glutamyl ligase n=1 Tax=Steroidobacter denitrificans TaxID=465721 RepID=A0A127F7Y5_STEDE|nr:coenzyme F420-0:L-glutamate ligase [Steroidobacter denitrificans]AMN46556.1 F420-0--gamma-glutamyl ligase [Steroidobacter denitrificans]
MHQQVQSIELSLLALGGLPAIAAGDDLASLIHDSLQAEGIAPRSDDVIVLAQKIVSKAEGRTILLSDVQPSARARELAQQCDKDPRLVELILSESQEVMRVRPGVIVVRHRLGLVLANAGIDQSNIRHQGDGAALLLPEDPDLSCRRLRTAIQERIGVAPAVVIIDSLGRAWRNGTVGIAIGAAGLPGCLDLRGRKDLFGRRLETSELGFADEVAAAASLLMGQADEGRPVVLLRGLQLARRDGSAAELIRSQHLDLFP